MTVFSLADKHRTGRAVFHQTGRQFPLEETRQRRGETCNRPRRRTEDTKHPKKNLGEALAHTRAGIQLSPDSRKPGQVLQSHRSSSSRQTAAMSYVRPASRPATTESSK